jgi:hypothetical protein
MLPAAISKDLLLADPSIAVGTFTRHEAKSKNKERKNVHFIVI